MRVLFLSAANSIHTVRWVNALSELGNEITLVSQRDHKALKSSVSRKVKIIYLPFGGGKGYYLNAIALRSIYKKGTFDIINVHYASGYGTLARIAKLPNILLSVWGSDVYDFPYESKLKETILRKNLKYASAIASTSHCMAKQTRKFLKSGKEIWVTPFGVDINRFCPDSNKKENGKFVFGIIKTLSSKYGIDTVIQAFAAFLDKGDEKEKENIYLEIYGKGELLEKLKDLARNLKIEKQVLFKGYIPNEKVPEALQRMDVFLLGSRLNSESFGVAAVEAMACGLPVIATKVDGFKEVVKDGITGFLVDIDDADEMGKYINVLYQDKGLRHQMGIKGRERAEKLYKWEENVTLMESIYDEMRCKR